MENSILATNRCANSSPVPLRQWLANDEVDAGVEVQVVSTQRVKKQPSVSAHIRHPFEMIYRATGLQPTRFIQQ